ncbi:hypothetical protein DHEL01_v204536 [Diaporthe helianthi]|uniref:Ecp2 effector protein-like domain-containing protein n=1 Tax=Diaporthe helianthi TaxID=158607 RepID=A0A2P5I3I3_DIAHE|nr:hypothetical protein DHEL01_v204536 [Diaporthe helianthi]
MQLTNTLLAFLTIALGTLAQNKSATTLLLNHTVGTLNFTEAAALARSLTWYHLDEDDEQELCGNTDIHLEGKDDILKADCQELVKFVKARPGYWKVNGYNSKGIGFADLVTRGTCEFTVTREDALSTYFE